jgi:hypothetical protein
MPSATVTGRLATKRVALDLVLAAGGAGQGASEVGQGDTLGGDGGGDQLGQGLGLTLAQGGADVEDPGYNAVYYQEPLYSTKFVRVFHPLNK